MVKALQLDVTSHQSIENAKSIVEQMLGSLDVLVNNAGIARASGKEGKAMLKGV